MSGNYAGESSARTPSRFAAAKKRLSSKSFASLSDFKRRSKTDPTVFHPHPFLDHPNPLGSHPVCGAKNYGRTTGQGPTSSEAPVLPPIDVGTTNIGIVLSPTSEDCALHDAHVIHVDATGPCDEDKDTVRVGSVKTSSLSSKQAECASTQSKSHAGMPVTRSYTLTKAHTTMGINVAQNFNLVTRGSADANGQTQGRQNFKENVPLKIFIPNVPTPLNNSPGTPNASAKPKARRARSMGNLIGMSRGNHEPVKRRVPGASEPIKNRVPSSLNLPPTWGTEHDRFITYLATHAPRAPDGRFPLDSAPYYSLPQIQALIRQAFPRFRNTTISTSTIDCRLQMLELSGNDYFQVAYGGYDLTHYEWARYV